MMKLRINPLVVADLKEIREYISKDNMEKATEIIEEFYSKFENLRLFPDMGTSLSRRVRSGLMKQNTSEYQGNSAESFDLTKIK